MVKIINGIEITPEQEKKIRYQAKLKLAQHDFWVYCHCRIPDFYKQDRQYLIDLCKIMQAIYEKRVRKEHQDQEWQILPRDHFFDHTGSFLPIEHQYQGWTVCSKLMINLPPRHGKSLTAQLFSEWCFGKDQSNRIITISYNETLSGRFSKFVRNGISATRADNTIIVFSDIFPGIKIKKGDASAQLWGLEGQHMSYLGGSPTGTLTGMGCNIGIIDDLIKNKQEAANANVLDGHYEFYGDTYLSRLEEGHIQILIMTRWSTQDLCGKLAKEAGSEFYIHEIKACNEETKEMLCSEVLSYESFEEKKRFTSPQIINANYQQKPIDDEGRLYKRFKIYTDTPSDDNGNKIFTDIACVIDTADDGEDFLCAIAFGIHNNEAYILDIYYTQEGMEITEPATAGFCIRNGIKNIQVESNNGGKGFARSVKRHVNETHNRHDIRFEWFHESRNKKARIITNSWDVMERVYFPVNWHDKFNKFYNDIVSYQKEGKNAHDDGPDCLTRVVEYINNDLPKKREKISTNGKNKNSMIYKLSKW